MVTLMGDAYHRLAARLRLVSSDVPGFPFRYGSLHNTSTRRICVAYTHPQGKVAAMLRSRGENAYTPSSDMVRTEDGRVGRHSFRFTCPRGGRRSRLGRGYRYLERWLRIEFG